MRVLLAMVLILGVFGDSAAAETPQQQADKLFAEGRDLLVNQKDAKGACEKFEAAIALDPQAPGVMLNLGLCYETLEKYATSLYWFRKARDASSEAKPEPLVEYETAAKTHTIDLAKKVATAKIDISLAPPGTTVLIDGRRVLPSEYARVEVDKDSLVEARATGKQVFRAPVQVNGQDAGTIQIVMLDEVVPPLRDPGKGRRRISYIVGAGGVVLWGVTIAYGLNVRGKYEDGKSPYDGPDGFTKARDDLRYIGTGLFAAGTVAVGVAIVLYVTAPKPYRERMEEGAFVPTVSHDQLGFAYGRAF